MLKSSLEGVLWKMLAIPQLIENFGAIAIDILQKRFANEKKILSLQPLK
jgi:hypothetical protein